MQLRHSLTERGRRAEVLYGETMDKWHNEGDLAAYSYVKQRMADVRKAALIPLSYDQVYGRTTARPNALFGSLESASRRSSTCNGTEATDCHSSLPSIEDDSVFDVGTDPVAPAVVIATKGTTPHTSTSSAGSSIVSALQRMFSVPERVPGEKLQKLVKELRSAQILYSSSERGDRSRDLLREIGARRRSDGDVAAYVHAKQNIRSVREASTSVSRWLEKFQLT
ncbi:hypothetical protein [Pinirhizobacter sp.]|uniref:hypothetical protein n=1 Tax=Pinirhizobacter sp. TaxID=2950432 RepID=UPI002F42372F